jgi:hypothetical protein
MARLPVHALSGKRRRLVAQQLRGKYNKGFATELMRLHNSSGLQGAGAGTDPDKDHTSSPGWHQDARR